MASELTMNVLGVILARGGSKRLPRKNIRELAGRPLISYTIEAAQKAKSLSRVIVSTDDDEIARIALAQGADVPFQRPAELARDESASIDALIHAVEWVERDGQAVDVAVLLQPTSPLRSSRHIDEAVALFRSVGVDTVTAVVEASVHPYWCWKPIDHEMQPFFSLDHVSMPRQELPVAWVETGAIYVIRRSVLNSGSLYGARAAGYLMDAADAVDIDTIDDFEYVEFMLRRCAKRAGESPKR